MRSRGQGAAPPDPAAILRRPAAATTSEEEEVEERESDAVSALGSPVEDEPPEEGRRKGPEREWVDWEDLILEDTVPLVGFVRMILHSGKYTSGDRLTPEHEKAILERLLPYHPQYEKKIGCGIDYITVRGPSRMKKVNRSSYSLEKYKMKKLNMRSFSISLAVVS